MPVVLNVNDDEARRYVLARILETDAFDVIQAATGQEALDVAKSKRPDVVLLDVKLPDLDGFEVCRRLKADPVTAPIPVVMLSAILVEPNCRVHGLESGADGYLTEPLHPEVVNATLRALLRTRAAEDALRESEAHYRTLFELNPLPSYVFDLDTRRILAVNHAAVEHYGYTVEEFLTLAITDLRSPADVPRVLEAMGGADRGPDRAGVWQHRRRDGSVFDADITTARMRYQGHDVRLAVVQDVTARQRAAARIGAQLAVTRVLAQSATVQHAIPRLLSAIGETLAWDAAEFWERRAPGDAQLVLTNFWHRPGLDVGDVETAGRLLAVGRGQGLPGHVWETRAPVWSADVSNDPLFLRTRRGSGLHAAFGFPATHDGQTTAVMVFLSRDIRRADDELLRAIAGIGGLVGEFMERRRAEEALREAETRYRLVARATNDVIWDLDLATGCRAVSEGITRFGYRPEEVGAVSRWGLRHVHPEDHDRVAEGFDAAVAGDGTFWSDEYRLRRADGSYATVSERGYIVRDDTGRAIRVVGATTDMTERQLAEERRRLRALSIGTLRAREEEARRIARELHDEAGQLLASVHIALDRLAADTPGLDRARVSEIKGLLELTEAELRRIAHELRPTILDDLGLGPALAALGDNVSSRSGVMVTIDAPIEDRLPPVVETTLYRIVQEAVANAVKHAEPSRVDVRVVETNGGLQCVIADNGAGFDPVAVAARGERGLGLLGIRERLEPLNGTLELASQPGEGTRVIVTIPLGAA